MTLYFNNSMSFYLQHTLKSTHINLDTSGKLANLRRDLRHINTFCSALIHRYVDIFCSIVHQIMLDTKKLCSNKFHFILNSKNTCFKEQIITTNSIVDSIVDSTVDSKVNL